MVAPMSAHSPLTARHLHTVPNYRHGSGATNDPRGRVARSVPGRPSWMA